MPESPDYREKKAFFDRVLTVYGRKPVMEVLQNGELQCHALHLAHSNRHTGIIQEILDLAQRREIPIKFHSREELSRISRNGRQDQGVAVDVLCLAFGSLDAYIAQPIAPSGRMLALDGITNPQNLGMIIRSAAAGCVDGIILPRKGSAALGPLVIKASAGTLYRAPLLLCHALPEALRQCQQLGAQVCTLQADATESLFDYRAPAFCIFVLGNETGGVSAEINALADRRLSIPMRNAVESLNVAVTASLIAYAPYLER